ncbi:unnamed protein product [Umbelopsis vinacea]
MDIDRPVGFPVDWDPMEIDDPWEGETMDGPPSLVFSAACWFSPRWGGKRPPPKKRPRLGGMTVAERLMFEALEEIDVSESPAAPVAISLVTGELDEELLAAEMYQLDRLEKSPSPSESHVSAFPAEAAASAAAAAAEAAAYFALVAKEQLDSKLMPPPAPVVKKGKKVQPALLRPRRRKHGE